MVDHMSENQNLSDFTKMLKDLANCKGRMLAGNRKPKEFYPNVVVSSLCGRTEQPFANERMDSPGRGGFCTVRSFCWVPRQGMVT